MDTIQNLVHAFQVQDGSRLGYFLTSVGNKEIVSNIDPLSIKHDSRIAHELKPVVEAYVEFSKIISADRNPLDVFTAFDTLMRQLNRLAESKPSWIGAALVKVTHDLIRYAMAADEFIAKNPTMMATKVVGDLEHEACLTKAARTIHGAFKLCLNDRNEDPSKSRKQYVYYFVGQEMRIYFKLQNRDLAKNMEKVLVKMSHSLPDLHNVEKSHAVMYLYYSGIVYCGDRDFEAAYKKFKAAFHLCNSKEKRHLESILVYLIPLKFIVTKKYPDLERLKSYTIAYTLYANIIKSVISGDLKLFDREFEGMEVLILKKNLYLVMEELRNFVVLKLLKRIYLANGSNPHLSIKMITRGIEFAKFHTSNKDIAKRNIGVFSSDEAECLVANMIYQGYIKGYLSHSNGVLVLSKKDPFPNQVKSDPK